MSEGIKWTITGGIIGIILLIVASLIFHQIMKLSPNLKSDWVLNLLFPIYFAVLFWGVKFFDKKNKDEITMILTEVNKKADSKEMAAKFKGMGNYLDDIKENNHCQIDLIYEFMSSIDNRLKDLTQFLLTGKSQNKKNKA